MSDIDFGEATEIAQLRIDEIADRAGDRFFIVPRFTTEVELGWAYFYNCAEYLRTGELSDSIVGNGPILVTRSGVVYELPAATPWENALADI